MRVERIEDATLYLGDAREIVPTLGAIDVLITDPPYGMAFQSNHRLVQHRAIANDKSVELLAWACSIPVVHSRYVFCRWDNLRDVPKADSAVTWVKNNWSMGDLNHEHARQTEMVLFWAGPQHFFPKGRPTDVIHAARTNNEHHPTEKPVSLMERIVEWSDGTVLDCFAGSASTGVACARLGRRFIGIELDEKHFETACRRVEQAYRQPRLFSEPAPKPQQMALVP